MTSFFGISGSQVDIAFRRALILSKLFTKSWGHPDVLKQMAKYRREVMSQRKVLDFVRDINPQVDVISDVMQKNVRVIDGHFHSPHATLFPMHMPGPSGEAYFRAFLLNNQGPLCIHLASTGDHSYFRRQYGLVEDLLELGINAIVIQNPFYGNRKPDGQFRSSLRNVSDLFVMGGALIAECNFLFDWVKQMGYGPFAISGVSMGGFMATLAASNAHSPLAVVPILSWTTASPSYTRGAISQAINYPLLQQLAEDTSYMDKIKNIPNVDWYDQMHEMSKSNGESLSINLMRILMDYFTSLANYPRPLDTSLCYAFVAEDDKYVLRDHGTPKFEDVWPGMKVEEMPEHGHVTSYLTKHKEWRTKIAELLLKQSPTAILR